MSISKQSQYIQFHESKNDKLYLEFNLYNVNVPLANGIRRILLEEIPIVSFNIDSVKVNENNTSLHNEYLQHRLSLIPIDNHPYIPINSSFDFNKNKRIYTFNKKIDDFTIIEENTYNSDDNYKQKVVLSSDIKINNKIAEDYFKPDLNFTDSKEYNIITYLKSNKISSEKIDILCTPTIGISKGNNACYNPTGTVSYHFIQEDDNIMKEKLKEYINYKKKENKNRGIDNIDVKELTNDFYKLDCQRIYKKNQYYFKIESVGNLYPYELLTNSLTVFQLKLIDLLYNITYKNNKLIFNKNISINNINNTYQINIKDEDHTLGNVINQYILDNFTEYIEYCSYKMIHPLKNELLLSINLKENLKDLSNKLFYYNNKYEIKYVNDNKNYIIYIFEYSIISILKDIDNIKKSIPDKYRKMTYNIEDINKIEKFKNIS